MFLSKAFLTMLMSASVLFTTHAAYAEILPVAEVGIKIALKVKPTTRPMTVAHIGGYKRYYIADGGLAPMGSELEAPISKSMMHTYGSDGTYINSVKPGYDSRSLYYNANSGNIETITYNISSQAGFSPNTGIFSITLNENGNLTDKSNDVFGFNPAFGDAATMPSFNPNTNQYYAKQERSNKVWVVDLNSRDIVKEIALDLTKANVKIDEISDHYIGFSGVAGEEFIVLDIDHKAVLVFNLKGEFVGKSELPKDLKLRSQNHFNGTGYANNMLFVYHEPEGEFGTYYGFKVLK